jgi:hypothetical protein
MVITAASAWERIQPWKHRHPKVSVWQTAA